MTIVPHSNRILLFLQVDLKQSEQSGVDDGHSVTRNLIPRLKALCQQTGGVSQVRPSHRYFPKLCFFVSEEAFYFQNILGMYS